MKEAFLFLALLAAVFTSESIAQNSRAQSQTPAMGNASQPFVVEYYYKARWGYGDEFLRLFKKNHYPVLKREIEIGRILQVTATVPRYHWTEDARWDYRITIVFKNSLVANQEFDEQAVIRQLFPDQETYKREEQRRFEILVAHWDLPIKPLDLNLDTKDQK
jgi:hypothetical protein